MPVSGCQTSNQYTEYQVARGSLNYLPLANLTTISTTDQDCNTFGVNKQFAVLADLYNANEAVFFANTGLLSKPMTKHDNWGDETSFQLFAHNTMQVSCELLDLPFCIVCIQ